jgi:hypothetical protein
LKRKFKVREETKKKIAMKEKKHEIRENRGKGREKEKEKAQIRERRRKNKLERERSQKKPRERERHGRKRRENNCEFNMLNLLRYPNKSIFSFICKPYNYFFTYNLFIKFFARCQISNFCQLVFSLSIPL